MYHEGAELLALIPDHRLLLQTEKRDLDSKSSESLGLLAKIVRTSANSPENRYKCVTPTSCSASLGACARGGPRTLWPQRAHCFRKPLTVSQHPKTLTLCALDLAQCRAPGRAGVAAPAHPGILLSVALTAVPLAGRSMLVWPTDPR